VIIEKASLILTFELETGRVIVVDQVTRDLLFQADTVEEPAEIDDDLPDIMWVGRLTEGQ
jgi:hypothetical protein